MKYYCEYCDSDFDDNGPYEMADGNYYCQDCMERTIVKAELLEDY